MILLTWHHLMTWYHSRYSVMRFTPFLAAWVLLPLQGQRVPPASSLTEVPRSPLTPLDLGSAVLADGRTVTFLSPNNSRLLAHQGSEVRLQCQIDKPPHSAMVTNNNKNNKHHLDHHCVQVTWTRRTTRLDTGERNLQLLSVGDNTYINDNRFIISNKKVDNVSED